MLIRGSTALEGPLMVPVLIFTSLIFHFTHDAGKPSPSSTKEMHISTVRISLNRYSEPHH